jgi:hypothetical protein
MPAINGNAKGDFLRKKVPFGIPQKTLEKLFDFLLQVVEDGRVEKVLDGDLQAVADFFDGGDGGGVISAGDDVVQGRLGQTANVG